MGSIYNSILGQFNKFTDTGRIPVLGYHVSDDEYLEVWVSVIPEGVMFTFDTDNKPVYFDGEVLECEGGWYVPFCEFNPISLDCYLEIIDNNITEGYLIPNDLYYIGE